MFIAGRCYQWATEDEIEKSPDLIFELRTLECTIEKEVRELKCLCGRLAMSPPSTVPPDEFGGLFFVHPVVMLQVCDAVLVGRVDAHEEKSWPIDLPQLDDLLRPFQ